MATDFFKGQFTEEELAQMDQFDAQIRVDLADLVSFYTQALKDTDSQPVPSSIMGNMYLLQVQEHDSWGNLPFLLALAVRQISELQGNAVDPLESLFEGEVVSEA